MLQGLLQGLLLELLSYQEAAGSVVRALEKQLGEVGAPGSSVSLWCSGSSRGF